VYLPGATVLPLDVTDQAAVDALEIETHYFGTLRMVRAFAPILGAGGGGAIVNMLSVLSWITFLDGTSYGAAKAARWSLTSGIPPRTREPGHRHGIARGALEVLVDPAAEGAKAALSADLRAVYPQLT
jgi:NAD(P)-dependent dehydrogenase (short-subunit alcohol dehydrogenase family)